ncbi:Heat shock 70 kDa protein 14 [Microtus ochrogaster]|uniref:Heat shock 70 kDa protein 14 n=1 Tax=Microtus ochrogaster TaxID=79684 RepID=A0A8J6G707_MICOH|nr:Heat shock 70 kDa protein 14 [Microtus ochrogaster]
MAAIGVHLGCTSACVAVYKDGRADVVANDAGDRVTPAIVAYSENEQVVGLAAKQSRVRNISSTVVKVKQLLGRSGDRPLTSEPPPRWARRRRCSVARTIAAELAENRRLARELSKREEEKLDRLIAIGEEASAQQDTANELRREAVIAARRLATAVTEKNGKLRYEIDTGEETKFVNPEDVARLIFSKMKETAHSVLGSDANDVVITVPFDFGEKQKSALGHVLVFKLGGTSLSLSVVEVNSGMYRVLSTNSNDNVGGAHFTETLAQYLASEFQRVFKHDVRGNARAMMKLINSAEVAKHSLSTLGSANCFVDSLYEGQDFDCNVSRARFELLCSPLFNKCIEAVRELLRQSGFTADDINKVVLCGGSSRIPRLQQLIKDLFPAVELLNSIPPDEVIPIGAAIEAGILVGKESTLVDDSVMIECSAKDILVKGVDESGANRFTVLFPSGTPLPARRQHTLQAPGSISSVCLELYESEGKNSAKEETKFAQRPKAPWFAAFGTKAGVGAGPHLGPANRPAPCGPRMPGVSNGWGRPPVTSGRLARLPAPESLSGWGGASGQLSCSG